MRREHSSSSKRSSEGEEEDRGRRPERPLGEDQEHARQQVRELSLSPRRYSTSELNERRDSGRYPTPERQRLQNELDIREGMASASQQAHDEGHIGHFPPGSPGSIDPLRHFQSVVEKRNQNRQLDGVYGSGFTSGAMRTNERRMFSVSGFRDNEDSLKGVFDDTTKKKYPDLDWVGNGVDKRERNSNEKQCAARKWEDHRNSNEEPQSSHEVWNQLQTRGKNPCPMPNAPEGSNSMYSCDACITSFPHPDHPTTFPSSYPNPSFRGKDLHPQRGGRDPRGGPGPDRRRSGRDRGFGNSYPHDRDRDRDRDRDSYRSRYGGRGYDDRDRSSSRYSSRDDDRHRRPHRDSYRSRDDDRHRRRAPDSSSSRDDDRYRYSSRDDDRRRDRDRDDDRHRRRDRSRSPDPDRHRRRDRSRSRDRDHRRYEPQKRDRSPDDEGRSRDQRKRRPDS